MILRWLRGWRERDDQHLFKVPDADPVDELIHVIDEAQARDAADERRLYPSVRGGKALAGKGRRSTGLRERR
jgi:hypothetical protein